MTFVGDGFFVIVVTRHIRIGYVLRFRARVRRLHRLMIVNLFCRDPRPSYGHYEVCPACGWGIAPQRTEHSGGVTVKCTRTKEFLCTWTAEEQPRKRAWYERASS